MHPSADPTAAPTPQPSPFPTGTPWFRTSSYFGVLVGNFALASILTSVLTLLFKWRLKSWPPLVRVASTTIGLMSIGSDFLFCFLSSTSAQFYGGYPEPGGWVILGCSTFLCSCALASRLYKTKLALDGEAALAKSSVYAPFLLLVAMDGDLIVWLPWRDTEATELFDGFPDLQTMAFPNWALATRKLPFLLYMCRTAVSSVQIASIAVSAISLGLSFSRRLLRSVALNSKSVGFVVKQASDSSTDHGNDESGRGDVGRPLPDQAKSNQSFASSMVKKRQTIAFIIVGLALSALTWTNRIPAVVKIISIMVVVLYILGGLAGFIAVAACIYAVYLYLLNCRKKKIISNSVLQMLEGKAEMLDKKSVELDGTTEELRAQRHLAERLQVRTEYTNRMLEAQGIKIDAFLPLEDVKQHYAAAMALYQETSSDASLAEVERWDRVLAAHPDLAAEKRKEEEAWRQSQLPRCADALALMRTFIPLNVRELAKSNLEQMGLTSALARRVANSTLSLLVTHPADIEKMHLADLSNKVLHTSSEKCQYFDLINLSPHLGHDWLRYC